jgi:hypothetical protein
MERLVILWSNILNLLARIPFFYRLKILRLVPSRYLIRQPDSTNRQIFRLERKLFRMMRSMSNEGYELDKRSYAMQKAIGKKYGWRYIKELYDKEA